MKMKKLLYLINNSVQISVMYVNEYNLQEMNKKYYKEEKHLNNLMNKINCMNTINNT